MKKYIVEFLGTFFLIITIVIAVNSGIDIGLAILAIGMVLIGAIYAGGHISKAHYNPAITLAFALRGRIVKRDILPYLMAQFLAAIAAALLGSYLLQHIPEATLPTSPRLLLVVPSLITEFLGTFLLAFVILQVATSKHTEGNQYYGVAIGFTVIGCALLFGPISRSALNPAVAIAMCMTEMAAWSDLWIYLLSSCAGAAAAAGVFFLTYEE